MWRLILGQEDPLQENGYPIPVFLPVKSQGQRRAWRATVHGVHPVHGATESQTALVTNTLAFSLIFKGLSEAWFCCLFAFLFLSQLTELPGSGDIKTPRDSLANPDQAHEKMFNTTNYQGNASVHREESRGVLLGFEGWGMRL